MADVTRSTEVTRSTLSEAFGGSASSSVPKLLLKKERKEPSSVAMTAKTANDRIKHAQDLRAIQLNLEGVSKTRVPPDVLALTNLATLYLGDNELLCLPAEFAALKKLKRLSLRNNAFREFPAALSSLPLLRNLDLSKNSITAFPTDLGMFARLEHLNMSHNMLKTIPPSIRILKRLDLLDLSHNLLEDLPAEMGALNVETLLLSHNQIKAIPSSFALLQNLVQADFSHNKIANLPPELGELTFNLQMLNLQDNPLQMPLLEYSNKGTSHLLDYLKELQRQKVEPEKLKGKMQYNTLDVTAFLTQTLKLEPSQVVKLSSNTRLIGVTTKAVVEVGAQFDMIFPAQAKAPARAPLGSLVVPTKGWLLESGRPLLPQEAASASIVEVDTSQFNTDYESFFFAKPKAEFFGVSQDGPMAVSIMKEEELYQETLAYRVLCRSKYGDQRFWLSSESVLGPRPKTPSSQPVIPASKSLLRALLKTKPELKMYDFKMVVDRAWPTAFRELERRTCMNCMSIGVIYAKEGQTADTEMFQNAEGSPDFYQFLDCLGERVQLQGWQIYNGGLDTAANQTGRESYYTTSHGYEIMFHVSTLLPNHPTDEQRLERKRHVGNDVCVIVFMDGNRTPFSPEAMKSNFNHVFAVVQVDRSHASGVHYKLSFMYKDGVRLPVPILAEPPVFPRGADFKHWLLVKLINAERCAYDAPSFAKPIRTMRSQMLINLFEPFAAGAADV